MTPTDIAVQFAACGYYVFPLYRGRNSARLKPYGWARNDVVAPDKVDKAIPATNDEKVVETWPDLVLRIYNSEVIGFGIVGIDCVILDLDKKNGKDGIAQFALLQSQHKIPKTPMATVSKSGGIHLFYQKPAKYRDIQLKTMSGIVVDEHKYNAIDLRGDGGFVVGPDMLVDKLEDVPLGKYGTVGLIGPYLLPPFPAQLMEKWIRPSGATDVDSMIGTFQDEDDFKALIRRGLIPEFVPKGARNESFFIFANVLHSKGVPIEAAREMCKTLAEKCEDRASLPQSVDVEAILSKAYVVQKDNPYDVAVDLVQRGLFQVTGYGNRLCYCILEDNPYIQSKDVHDETSMKVLLTRFQKAYTNDKGKSGILNPMTVVTKIIGHENQVDMIGFKPNAGEVFSLHDEPGAKRFLNTYRPIPPVSNPRDLEDQVWAEFDLLMTRLFGEKGSDDYVLGMDFFAWLLQRPEVKPSIAPFVMSVNRGVGKSLLFNVIVQIMGTAKDGERQARFVKLDEISGRFFNPSGCLINLIDEVQFPVHQGMRKESTAFWRHLKNLITAETISVEIKGGSTYQCPNTAAVAMAGNFGSYFPIEEFDRRLWIIDNNAPLLERGEVDHLFSLVKRNAVDTDDRLRYIDTIRWGLRNHKIKNDLSSIRAPMTSTKQEMYENSLTDLEEWFVTHFKDRGNLFAFTPIVSQSALDYTYEQCNPLGDQGKSVFRELKRKGFLRGIRTADGLPRQVTVPEIGMDGTLIRSDRKSVLYTTRNHGSYDGKPGNELVADFTTNCATITRFKTKKAELLRARASQAALIER